MTESEVISIGSWAGIFADDKLASAMAQIPPTTGFCLRSTELTPEALKMLKTSGKGLLSGKTGGVYEVRIHADVLRVKTFLGQIVEDEEEIRVMNSMLGLQRSFNVGANYRFAINSRTGRYIEPLLGDRQSLSQVSFVQGYDNLKLLGWEELNGGEAANAAGKAGSFSVF
ncbi:hypothetical protein ACJQWK_06210 [Exserohilum turcicum]